MASSNALVVVLVVVTKSISKMCVGTSSIVVLVVVLAVDREQRYKCGAVGLHDYYLE
jgi:hypothetical protein